MIEVFTAVKTLVREDREEEDSFDRSNDYSADEGLPSFHPSNLADTFGDAEQYTNSYTVTYECESHTVEVGMLDDNADEDVYYPLDDMLDDALSKGLVVADVCGRIVHDDHVSFAVKIQMLNLPGLTEPYSNTRMFFMKKYTDFKAFHLDLSHVADASLPPLPSREIMSLGFNSDEEFSYQKSSFLNTRQTYLKNWLNSVLMRQSSESILYRQVLKNFLKG